MVYTWVDINCLYLLFIIIYILFVHVNVKAKTVSKNHYPYIRMVYVSKNYYLIYIYIYYI
jgi:hypothetical protein